MVAGGPTILSTSDPRLVELKAPIAPFLADWHSIDLKVVALPLSDGRWVYNAVHAVFDIDPPSYSTRVDLPIVRNLLVAHERWGIDRIDELLSSMITGELKIAGQDIMLMTHNGGRWVPHHPGHFILQTKSEGLSRYNVGVPCYVREVQDSMSSVLNNRLEQLIDPVLGAGDPPWNGLRDLQENFVGLVGWSNAPYMFARMDVIAPLNVSLEGSRVEGDSIRIHVVRSPLSSVNDLSISIIATKGRETTLRRRYNATRDDGAFKISKGKIEASIKLEGSPTRVMIFLGYKGLEIDSETLHLLGPQSDPKARVLELEGINNLEKLLAGNGEQLERGVAILFHVLGFDAVSYARGFGDSADIVAFSPNRGPVFVIECTAGVLNSKDKLSKLVLRARDLGEKASGQEVRLVVVTTLKRSQVSESNKDDARKDGIIVVTSDDFPRLLQMVSEGSSNEKVQSYLQGLLGSPFGGGFGVNSVI